MLYRGIFLVSALVFSFAVSVSHAEAQEIVVTASRTSGWSSSEIPSARMSRRADNLIAEVRIVNDTRDARTRRNEILQTLRTMNQMAAARPDIALSVDQDGELIELNADMLSTLTFGVDGSRADTSVAKIILKTPVKPNDTLDAASQRLEGFLGGVSMSGRSLASLSTDWRLTLVNPSQYRAQILAMIAEDSRQTLGAFGTGYAVEVGGLERDVAWYQSGSLDLKLFIPYEMKVTPRP